MPRITLEPAYAPLYRYRRGEGWIALHFSKQDVQVTGLRLDDGYGRLFGHRVLQSAEADTPTAKLLVEEASQSPITDIAIEKRTKVDPD